MLQKNLNNILRSTCTIISFINPHCMDLSCAIPVQYVFWERTSRVWYSVTRRCPYSNILWDFQGSLKSSLDTKFFISAMGIMYTFHTFFCVCLYKYWETESTDVSKFFKSFSVMKGESIWILVLYFYSWFYSFFFFFKPYFKNQRYSLQKNFIN